MDIEVAWRIAQIPQHRPVDGSHVIEYKRVKSRFILLTLFWKRVKSHSFFDILKVFPVGGESGIQARSPCTAQAESIGGPVRICSDLPVEENIRCSKAKIEAPSC